MNGFKQIAKAFEVLERRKVITTELEDAEECCGMPRDDDGFCIHRPGHPAYVDLLGRFDG